MTDDEYDLYMNKLLETGALEVQGIDENGEFIYKFNMTILQGIAPEMYEQIMDDLNEDLMRLYQMGLVDVEYDENLKPKFKVSDFGKYFLENQEDLDH